MNRDPYTGAGAESGGENAAPEDWLQRIGADLTRLFERQRSRGESLDGAVRGVLLAALERLDVVSRDEFDAQTELLRRAHARLAAIEARLAAYEQVHGPDPDPDAG